MPPLISFQCWLMCCCYRLILTLFFQDGHDPINTRYSLVDGAPWSFVFECKESSLPQEALDAVYLFSPHSMSNLRGAMVPTSSLVPRIESLDHRKWKIVGVWKKKEVSSGELQDDDDDDGRDDEEERARLMRGVRNNGGGIHDMDFSAGMPSLVGGGADGTDLENVSPVRIEAWMTKVFHYNQDADVTGDTAVLRKVFCILTVTPVRNFNLAEYLRHSIVENTQGTTFAGMSQQASESMRKDRKDMLHRLLLGQMELCGFFGIGGSDGSSRGGVPDPLDALNMPSTDYYPANYLSVPMAYRRIQYFMHKHGYNHKRIYVEGFSETVSKFTISDLRQVKAHNNAWAPSFYSAVGAFEALKPEDRADYSARLLDACPPSWARADAGDVPPPPPQDRGRRGNDDDDVERPAQPPRGGGLDDIYIQKNRMPPIKVCLWYNPLMYMSPSATRSEWEQQLGGFPAFFIYTMSRSIYSSATNPLLKPEYFMPEAKSMTTHAR